MARECELLYHHRILYRLFTVYMREIGVVQPQTYSLYTWQRMYMYRYIRSIVYVIGEV